jgi:prepilin-type N-terminal cleavage/methylation domain-containing protein
VALYRNVRGFSLVEMMIVVVLMAIALSIALPATASFVHGQSVASAGSELYGLLQYARGEAVTRGQRVTVVASADDAWAGEVEVQAVHDGETVTLRHQDALGDGSILASSASQAFSSLEFYPNGSASGSTSITLCHASDAEVTGRVIAVARSGQVSAPEAQSCQ